MIASSDGSALNRCRTWASQARLPPAPVRSRGADADEPPATAITRRGTADFIYGQSLRPRSSRSSAGAPCRRISRPTTREEKMSRTRALVLLIAVAAIVWSAAIFAQDRPIGTGKDEPGWTSLFNGKDFTGWKIGGPATSFTIQDGAIVANGVASHCYYDGSFRNHRFRNFELKVDIMTRPGSNGGVYVLTDVQEDAGRVRASGNFPWKGFEM